MRSDCYPVAKLPHATALFQDFVSGNREKLLPFYADAMGVDWMQHPPKMETARRQAVVELLRGQNRSYGAGAPTESNLDQLAAGAGAVVTGQQVALFGGPLMTLMKAATAVHMAAAASRAGYPHVPVFWMASTDHDFEEVNQATFLCEKKITTLRLPHHPAPGKPVGSLPLGDAVLPLLDQLRRCLGESAVMEMLASFYRPDATFASAFASLLTRLFSKYGLIVIDASGRPFHALARSTLRIAIEQVDSIHAALLERNQALEKAGYHAQVTVGKSSSLLFLIDASTGVRHALKKLAPDSWTAGSMRYTTSELLSILESAPERISPNVLLRPVVEDTLLPTSVYIGGPSEVAYFAQSQVVYEQILGRTTPVVPRYSATLVDPATANLLEQYALTLPDVFTTGDQLSHRLGARAMPIEGKQKLAAAGKALQKELEAVAGWMRTQDAGLGHAADVAASKMMYQMNRLRRISANFQLQRDATLLRDAERLCRDLYPNGNLQERVFAGVAFLTGDCHSLIDLLVENAQTAPSGHHALYL